LQPQHRRQQQGEQQGSQPVKKAFQGRKASRHVLKTLVF
jgi:hypothetical protein